MRIGDHWSSLRTKYFQRTALWYSISQLDLWAAPQQIIFFLTVLPGNHSPGTNTLLLMSLKLKGVPNYSYIFLTCLAAEEDYYIFQETSIDVILW